MLLFNLVTHANFSVLGTNKFKKQHKTFISHYDAAISELNEIPFRSNDQIILAILCAYATTVQLNVFFDLNWLIHILSGSDFRCEKQTTDLAPWINNVRHYCPVIE